MIRVHGAPRTAHPAPCTMHRAPCVVLRAACLVLAACAVSCARSTTRPQAHNLLLITIDTLRADHVGAYGYARAPTPALDALARSGMLFERAYAAAPITLPSHATMLTGRYPPHHGARDNGVAMSPVPTLATALHERGFQTAAFVAAFPLDHQFGLSRGFDVYSDRLPRGSDGHPANERPGAQVVDEAIDWLGGSRIAGTRFFLWVHLFEPHAPYKLAEGGREPLSNRGAPVPPQRPVLERYDEEIATADREVGRLVEAIAPVRGETLVIVAGDHGEAFGEHGEFAHSIFVYDTTLRVPLIMNGPGIHGAVAGAVTLADVAPTAAGRLGFVMNDVDGIDLSPAIAGTALPTRELYAESFAPLLEFGWAPLRAIRTGTWKLIAAPKPELFDVEHDAGEQANVVATQETVARSLEQRVNQYSSAALSTGAATDSRAAERLRALGYLSGSGAGNQSATNRPDPKDRRELAARIAQVTSGELQGGALAAALEAIVRDDPRNGQAHLRLAYARLDAGDCTRAEPEFHAAAAAGLPSADIYLGLATCLGRRQDLVGAERALSEARRLEPDNPVIIANVGILQASKGNLSAAIDSLNTALTADPNLLEARFNLALAYARAGRNGEAAATARELLSRLPATAPQRLEVERLLRSVR